MFEPTQILEFLGFLLNSLTMRVALTLKKITHLINECRQVLSKARLTICELALVSAFPGVEFGQLHYRTFEQDKSSALKIAFGNFEAAVVLPPESRQDLHWWITVNPN